MKALDFSRCALFAGCVAIAACSQATQLSRFQYTPSVNSAPRAKISPLSYGLLYSFLAPPDASDPIAGVIDVSGTLYGTTNGGGTHNLGTVFKLMIGSSKDKVLHNFGGWATDGTYPYHAGLIDVGGTLYGTTEYGGEHGYGTVFKIGTSGTSGYKVLYSFKSGTDAEYPDGGLTNVGGTLYGTSVNGGLYGLGALFSITTTGSENVLYSFGYGSDGANPEGGLINVSGTLYATTFAGGKNGAGAVVSMTTGGAENWLYSFDPLSGSDGSNPIAGLTNFEGTLYGTTKYGGRYANCAYGCGTVFSITTGGKQETVLHSFASGAADGAYPIGGLIYFNGEKELYGTTYNGGKYSNGTVFLILLKGGSFILQHSFGLGSDGQNPRGAMIYVAGNLIGTTSAGGANGYGTVFSQPKI